jgi:branched-chain amino acid transport system ATP-binding protein
MKPLLELQNISVHFGGVQALDSINITLGADEIVALMGPNGAGKSTVLKTIFGLVLSDQGNIFYNNKITVPVPYKMAENGITFVPQGRRVFSHLSVEENLEIGGFIIKNKEELAARISEAMKIFPVLYAKRKLKSGALSGGEQQMLAIARGLIARPKILLLDEPSLGLAPRIVKEVFAKIREINLQYKVAIMVVEHNIKSLLKIAHRAYVLDKGRIAAAGYSQEVAKSGIIEKVFL